MVMRADNGWNGGGGNGGNGCGHSWELLMINASSITTSEEEEGKVSVLGWHRKENSVMVVEVEITHLHCTNWLCVCYANVITGKKGGESVRWVHRVAGCCLLPIALYDCPATGISFHSNGIIQCVEITLCLCVLTKQISLSPCSIHQMR